MDVLNITSWKIITKTKIDVQYGLSIILLLALVFHWNTCLVDAFYILVFLGISIASRIRFNNSEILRYFIFLHLIISCVLILDADKVANYPEHKYELIKFAIYGYLFLLLSYSVKFLFKKSTAIYTILGSIFVYFPLLEIPQDATRQLIGYVLVMPKNAVYFTKIQTDKIYSVVLRRPNMSNFYPIREVAYFGLVNGHYEELGHESFVAGDGSMDAQYINENNIVFKVIYGHHNRPIGK